MKIEIVAIGNELLSGFVINTNAAFISEGLLKEGLKTQRHTVLPDDAETLRKGLEDALERSDLVICTGGLGPTCDDITRNVAAGIFQSGFRYDEETASELKRRYGDYLISVDDQSTVPSKALLLKNNVGTAPGMVFQQNGKTLILLPGVPPEMKAMWVDQVVPYMRSQFPALERIFNKRLSLMGLRESTVDIVLRELLQKHPNVEFGIYPGQMVLGVNISTIDKDPASAMKRLETSFEVLMEKFGENVYDSPSGKIEEAVHHRFLKDKATLAVAESCTGGSVAAHLTKLPGSSQYFLGSIVAYSNAAKTQLLGVPELLLAEKGAVSEEVVRSMLNGVFSKTPCDYGIAVSGIAGPSGGTLEKPVGTVWLGVGRRDSEPRLWQLRAYGNREMVIQRSVNILLGGLLKYMSEIN